MVFNLNYNEFTISINFIRYATTRQSNADILNIS